MYVERDVENKFRKICGAYNVVAMVGARQSGKTTFLKERIKQMNSSYVLFDDPDVRSLFEEDIKKFEKQYIEGHDVAVLDEVQYCNDAGTKLKYLADKGRKIWLTSSSEIILGKEILSYLVGRVSIIRLYPFSLSEFLLSRGQKEITQQVLERSVWEHMTYGGYPKAVITEDVELKKTILSDLCDTIILKDVARTFSIDDIRALEEFVKLLSLNIGNVLPYESISNDMKISFQTVKKYLDAMEKSYIIARIRPFFTNKIKEITKRPKVYFVDTGLRNSVAKAFGTEPSGNLFENYVMAELMKLGFLPKYWRTKSKAEVDFVIEKNSDVIPIEVKLNAVPGRIEKSLRSFIDAYKPKLAIVVSYRSINYEMHVGGCRVIFTNALDMRKIIEAAGQ